MFKTVFKMFTSTPLNRLCKGVFDIFYNFFDKILTVQKIYDLLKSFVNYTKWRIDIYEKNKCSLSIFNNKKLAKKYKKILLKTEKKPNFPKIG